MIKKDFTTAKKSTGACVKCSPAFTLAETLITLVIIGVVAAMTIPSVLNHYKKNDSNIKTKEILQ